MTTYESSYQSLRVMLDTKLPARSMIAVSGACDGDGQSDLARGLARAFTEAGRETLLVSLYDRSDESDGAFLQLSRAPKDLKKLVVEVRSQHDLVVALVPSVAEDAVALQVCRLANGVLLAVRLGRKITARDEATVTQLQRVSANLLGVVAVQPQMGKPRAQRDVTVAAPRPLEAPAN